MVSLDLSRAFDQLPRWALQASLEHARVDAAEVKQNSSLYVHG